MFSLKKFNESIICCDRILENYPNNGDVLYDKSCNLVMLSEIDEGLDTLEKAIVQGIQYKIKAKKSSSFVKLMNDKRFQQMIL